MTNYIDLIYYNLTDPNGGYSSIATPINFFARKHLYCSINTLARMEKLRDKCFEIWNKTSSDINLKPDMLFHQAGVVLILKALSEHRTKND